MNSQPLRLTAPWFAVFLAIVVSGCVIVPPKRPVTNVSELKPGEIILVGRFEVVPALGEDEQDISGILSKSFDPKNAIYLYLDDKFRKFDRNPSYSDMKKGYIQAKLGETFYLATSDRPFYILLGTIYLLLGGGYQEQVYLPGGLKVDIREGDQAVYIGTVRYHRNDFWDIEKAEILDAYNEEKKIFAGKFGTGVRLRKALVTTVEE